MPVFVEDPTQFSKQRLKSALISHSVELPPGESKKEVYVDLYMKHVWNKSNADFSSDDEDPAQDGTDEEEKIEEADMVDLSSLTDDQLKKQLLQYGVKAGPIVGSTRALYERKLQRLMAHSSQFKVNGTSDAAKYSDSEEEEEEDEDEEESGSEQLGPESVSRTETSATARSVGLYSQSKDLFYPQCFFPTLRQGKKQQESLESTRSSSQSFSITELVEEGSIENRLSPQSKPAGTERRCSQTPKDIRVLWDLQQLNKSTMTNTSLYLTPECLPHQKQTTTIKPAPEPVIDILTELFPEAATTPTGITATKRRSIKGAAGRPVQFKYLETPLSPATLERREIQQRLVPLWVQIVVFLLVAALLYLIYVSMDDPLENPFSALLDSLTEEPALTPSSQDISTSEVAA
ncbi:LEM domain-containing protein 1 [Colossoma macropomum]|uniref:LEM domain-containing protein 1 n=1 Tax=Colossoma macropomum TaxID=42526 RepID=UPI001863F64C|nr:LEM domain-containing protein 1 [Colossoma macropomum]